MLPYVPNKTHTAFTSHVFAAMADCHSFTGSSSPQTPGCCAFLTFPLVDFSPHLLGRVYKLCPCSLRHPGWAPSLVHCWRPLSDWLDTASVMLGRGSARPWRCPQAQCSLGRVPEVKGPCSNHDTICYREGYSSVMLISLFVHPDKISFFFPSLLGQQRGHASGGSYKQPEGRAQWLLWACGGHPVCAIWARPDRRKKIRAGGSSG